MSTSIIKPEPASDHEDEVDKVARQQEVKILVKKKPRLDKSPIKAVKNDALLSKIKEEPLDFDERVDEAFVVESKRLEERDLIKVVRRKKIGGGCSARKLLKVEFMRQ